MSDGPVQDLIDQLKLMRVELGDLKKRQVSEERLTNLQAVMEDTAEQIAGVREAAALGGAEGTRRIHNAIDQTSINLNRTVDDAVRALSEARREASGAILARRRNVSLLALFSALTGLATGALLTLIVFDHYLERDFRDAVQTVGLDLACRARGGFISTQESGKFCVFEINE